MGIQFMIYIIFIIQHKESMKKNKIKLSNVKQDCLRRTSTAVDQLIS